MLPVAIDGRRLQDNQTTGVSRYLENVLSRLARRSDLDLTLLTQAGRPRAALDIAQVQLAPRRAPGLAWLEFGAGRWARRRDVVFHGPFNAVPFVHRGPSVVTIHDLSWETHPEGFSAAKRRAWQIYGRASVRGAEVVVTVSEFSRDEIVRTYGIPADRIVVARNSVGHEFGADKADPSVGRRLGLPARYVVAIGGAPRRGLEVAIEAWRRARATQPDVALAVYGRQDPRPEPGLVNLGRVDDQALAAVMAGAEAFLYPTRYEGYGLPAHEALVSGTPVVCARVASLPEVLGDAAAWCDQPTAAELGGVLADLLADPGRRATLRARSLDRARALPSWDDAADATATAYHRAATIRGERQT